MVRTCTDSNRLTPAHPKRFSGTVSRHAHRPLPPPRIDVSVGRMEEVVTLAYNTLILVPGFRDEGTNWCLRPSENPSDPLVIFCSLGRWKGTENLKQRGPGSPYPSQVLLALPHNDDRRAQANCHKITTCPRVRRGAGSARPSLLVREFWSVVVYYGTSGT